MDDDDFTMLMLLLFGLIVLVGAFTANSQRAIDRAATACQQAEQETK